MSLAVEATWASVGGIAICGVDANGRQLIVGMSDRHVALGGPLFCSMYCHSKNMCCFNEGEQGLQTDVYIPGWLAG